MPKAASAGQEIARPGADVDIQQPASLGAFDELLCAGLKFQAKRFKSLYYANWHGYCFQKKRAGHCGPARWVCLKAA